MMESELLHIQPEELKFSFELRKQSSCLVQLSNKSDKYVAFKVKTTSPKRYCVRPNTGIILPRSSCEFTVIMQAQRTAPPDMQLKDKFLVQSTVIPFGSTDEDIVPGFFSKENGRHIEEFKLRVVLVSPPHSPVLQPLNGTFKQAAVNETPIVKESPIPKESPIVKEAPSFKDALVGDENLGTSQAKEIEDLKLKLSDLDMKLIEAYNMITMLREEKNLAIQARDRLQREITLLRRKAVGKAQAGFPPFFVLFIMIVGIAIGCLLRP
ncbi:Vesicle-associated protein 2-2 [Apostasia shenzhenica]|uniref:Vesicle-associated protein 2-2 n=1 Tax=Apostasia shenzhenica TaxID=1088818 RepID=A0A2I0BAI5_9ASPA|nr:Vesicle-associated protein 2-2 [Apostasia shenzhenica]